VPDIKGWKRLKDYNDVNMITFFLPPGSAKISENDGSVETDNDATDGTFAKISNGRGDDKIYASVQTINNFNFKIANPSDSILINYLNFQAQMLDVTSSSQIDIKLVKLGGNDFYKIDFKSNQYGYSAYILYLPDYETIKVFEVPKSSEVQSYAENVMSTVQEIAYGTNYTQSELKAVCDRMWNEGTIAYSDKNLDFSLRLPQEWQGKYHAEFDKQYSKVTFFLNTNDPDWLKRNFSSSGIFAIIMTPKNDWLKLKNQCAIERDPSCQTIDGYLTEKNGNVYSMIDGSSETPNDLYVYYYCADQIKKYFK